MYQIVHESLSRALAEQLAALLVIEMTGVAVVFEVRLAFGMVGASVGQLLAAGHLKLVIAQCAAGYAGLQADMERVNRWRVRHQATVTVEGRGGSDFLKEALAVAKPQVVAVGGVPEVVVDAFFFAQALDEVQITFLILHAVIACRVVGLKDEPITITENAVLFEDLANDLLDGLVLENPLIGSVTQNVKLRHQRQGVVGQAFAAVALGNLADLPVDTRTVG